MRLHLPTSVESRRSFRRHCGCDANVGVDTFSWYLAYRTELGVRACSRSFSLCRRPLSAANGLHPDGDSVGETCANGGRRTSRRRISSEACRLQSVWSPGDPRCSMYMVHETLLWVNSMMTFLLVFTVPHSIANSDFECSSMVQSLQQPLRPQVSKHGQGVSCLAPLGLMSSARSTCGIATST